MIEAESYLLDTGVVSSIRAARRSPAEYVGSGDLAVSDVVVDELFADLPADDPKAVGNIAVLAMLADLIAADEGIVALAEQLAVRYAAHEPPLAPNDALIAAVAMRGGRVLITKNRRDFHYVEGLRMVDASGFMPSEGPLLRFRNVVACEPSNQPCCRGLRS